MTFRSLEIRYDDGKVDLFIINNFEREFNIKLSRSYIDLISKHNGVALKEDYFDYFDYYNNESALSSIDFDSFETEDNIEPADNILAQYIYDDLEYGYPHVYSFGSTGNGDWVCFDYREDPTTDEPKICIVIHDEYDEEIGKRLLFPVANSFDEFLGGLYDFNEKYPL